MNSIPLHNKAGEVVDEALVDLDDYERLGHLRWYLHGTGYVRRNYYVGNGQTHMQSLHRAVLRLGKGDTSKTHVDHIDRNKLNNTKDNLRVIPQRLNKQTRAAARTYKGVSPSSTYRGVFFSSDGRSKPWRAVVNLEGVKNTVGSYTTEAEAILAVAAFRVANLSEAPLEDYITLKLEQPPPR